MELRGLWGRLAPWPSRPCARRGWGNVNGLLTDWVFWVSTTVVAAGLAVFIWGLFRIVGGDNDAE